MRNVPPSSVGAAMESQGDAALLGKYAIEGLRVHSVTTFHGLFFHFLCIDRHAISQVPALLPCHEFSRPEGLYPCGATSQTNPFFLKLCSVMAFHSLQQQKRNDCGL